MTASDQRRDLEAEIRALDTTALDLAYGNTLADFALAERYEHNANLRPAIRHQLDLLTAERERRRASPRTDGPRVLSEEEVNAAEASAKATGRLSWVNVALLIASHRLLSAALSDAHRDSARRDEDTKRLALLLDEAVRAAENGIGSTDDEDDRVFMEIEWFLPAKELLAARVPSTAERTGE